MCASSLGARSPYGAIWTDLDLVDVLQATFLELRRRDVAVERPAVLDAPVPCEVDLAVLQEHGLSEGKRHLYLLLVGGNELKELSGPILAFTFRGIELVSPTGNERIKPLGSGALDDDHPSVLRVDRSSHSRCLLALSGGLVP